MIQILNITGSYQLPDNVNDCDNAARFDYIYDTGLWGVGANNESLSGSGSTIENSKLYLKQLNQYFDEYKKLNNKEQIKFFDAPCGDLNWVKNTIQQLAYIGGDISPNLIADLQKKFISIDLRVFDIIIDQFPEADIWHCRHCHFHLSLSDIAKSLENFCQSNIETALLTNHFLPDRVTFDIPTGSFRFIDLTNFPFYLPKPQVWLLDSNPLSGKVSVATGVWTKSHIKVGVENYRKLVGV